MKQLILAALAASLSAPAFAQAPADSTAAQAATAFVFNDVITIPVTSVKDQNKSGTCWCFAGTSHLENEILKNGGDSLDLSEMFTVRHCYADKAEKFVRMYGQTNFAAGGSTADVPYVFERYGAVPEEVYRGLEYGEDKHVHGELDAALTAFLKAVVAKPNKKITTAWRKALDAILDAYLGPLPESFTYKGKTYTPKSYAESLGLDMDDYVKLTSFTHHPFYTNFAIEVPDNWLWAPAYNIPLDELQATVDNALENGYTVVWGADVSEGGFKWKEGVALMPKGKTEGDMNDTELSRWVKLSDKDRQNDKYNFKAPVEEIEVSQELRQEMIDCQETTEDHGMVIVGTATDQKGNKYYKVKNSWDTNQVYDGYFYVSMPYFRAKTMDILVNKKGLPKDLAKKMGR